MYVEVVLQRCSYEKAPRKKMQQVHKKHPCQSATPTMLLCSFIEVKLQHRHCPTNPQSTLPQEQPQRTASVYIQKFKLT